MTDREIFSIFFQKQVAYYLDKQVQYENGKKYTFNPYAFLFGIFWFMYRKMYLEAVVVIVAIIIESILENAFLANTVGQDSRINILMTLAIASLIGFLGNFLYLRRANKIVTAAKYKYTNEDQLKIYLAKKGGISFIFLIVIGLLIIAFFIYNNYLANNGNLTVILPTLGLDMQ